MTLNNEDETLINNQSQIIDEETHGLKIEVRIFSPVSVHARISSRFLSRCWVRDEETRLSERSWCPV